MDSKINGRMNPTISSSTDTRVTDLIDAGYSSSSSGSNSSSSNTKLSNQNHPQSLHCISSSMRNFGNAGALGVDGAVFKDCNNIGLVDGSLAAKQFCDPGNNDYLKCETALWEDFVNIQRGTHLNMNANVATSESLPSANPRLTSTTGACKFIKDEKEPSVIIDTPCPNFDTSSSSDIQLLGNGDLTRFTPSVASSRQGLSGSPHFMIDLNQSPEQLSALNQVRTDSRCGIVVPVKAVSNFDSNMHTAAAQQQQQQMTLCKTEVSRWQMQTSPAEAQYWCQSDDPFTHSGYDGSQSQALMSMRNPTQCSIFQGIPPHRMCVICSDEASGCHYGVLTCGSCKVFFKRAVEGHHSYLCAGRNDCIVDKLRRKNCPACRLRKCYQAGMMLGGRKLKRFGALKAFGMAPSLMFQSHLAMSGGDNGQALSSIPGIREMHLSQQILNILESIEPEVVYSEYDNTQLDGPHVLLNSLNRLCEKQLLWIVKWSKSLPGFRNLHINDQMTLIQYSWMNLMVFSLGWRSFQNVTSEYLYFAPDLVLNQEQMRRTPIYDICLAIQFIPQEFFNLQVTREEFLCMKAIILLNTVPLEGLKAQAAFEEMRQSYIRELTQAIHMREKGLVASSQRFYHLTKLMDSMHDIVKKVNLFCLTTYIQADSMRVEFPEMMSEVISSQLPKILAGMVRPLLFHTK